MPSPVSAQSVASPESGEGHAADAEPPIGLVVDVVYEAADWSPLQDAIKSVNAAAAAVAAELDVSAAEACIALSSDANVATLNATYRGKPAPTNVLSFPAGGRRPDQAQPRVLGDLVLARETIEREAAAMGVPLDHHLQHLVVHGLLHLLGFDHQTDEDARQMEACEVRILSNLGIANPYEAAEEPGCRNHTEYSKP